MRSFTKHIAFYCCRRFLDPAAGVVSRHLQRSRANTHVQPSEALVGFEALLGPGDVVFWYAHPPPSHLGQYFSGDISLYCVCVCAGGEGAQHFVRTHLEASCINITELVGDFGW